MARQRFDVEVPDGQHLGFSRDTDGAYRAHLFNDDGNNLVGHAELFEPDEDEAASSSYGFAYDDAGAEERSELTEEEIADALAALVGLAVIVTSLAVQAAPHVKKWWNARLRPAVTWPWGILGAVWNRLPKRDNGGSRNVEVDVDAHSAGDESIAAINAEFDAYSVRMSSAEARKRFAAALIARSFSDLQMKLLRDAELEDDADLELNRVVAMLTPSQVGETLALILEKNPGLVDPESLTELRAVLGSARLNGGRVPLRIERTGPVPPHFGESAAAI